MKAASPQLEHMELENYPRKLAKTDRVQPLT